MKSLGDLTIKKFPATVSLVPPFPRKITTEERREMHLCPLKKYYVSVLSCFQCPHYEIASQEKTTLTKKSGDCQFPRKASKESRVLTGKYSQHYEKARGQDVSTEESSMAKTTGTKVETKKASPKKAAAGGRVAGAFAEKKDFVRSLLKGKPLTKDDKERKAKVVAQIKKKYPEMSDAYVNTLCYGVSKELAEASMTPKKKK